MRLQEAEQAALAGGPCEAALQTRGQLEQLIDGYHTALGESEQSLPGEDEALDPLLERAPAAEKLVSPPGVAAEPSQQRAGGLETPAPAPLSEMSVSAKRALLERILRRDQDLSTIEK
jgi:hypothetical protein